jgi:cytochrome d ubiquinol oxidase subunit II
MTILLLILFLFFSILFYTLFAGADFGAGILEFFSQKKHPEEAELIEKALGPVWEANHIWLILALVIVMVGFPEIYQKVLTFFHFPILFVLIGIVGRGVAFSFRHYDPDKKFHKHYSILFRYSSLWTSFWLGLTVGALQLGKLDPYSHSYSGQYFYSWMSFFSVSTGLFMCTLFSFLACCYLISEAESISLRENFIKKAKISNLFMVLAGAFVFVSGILEKTYFVTGFYKNVYSLICFLAATGALFQLWFYIEKKYDKHIRALAVIQVSLVVLGWFLATFPDVLFLKEGALSFYSARASYSVMRLLLYSLLLGSMVIFPGLFLLFRIFKFR